MNEENINRKQIQWFPGHMARARRVLEENLKLVDVVVEIVDARIPFSSRNPEIDKLLGQKPRVIIGNKKDLSDPKMNGFWKNYYAGKGIQVYYTDCKSGSGVKDVIAAVRGAMAEKFRRFEENGRRPPIIRAMAVGIPNVGKSSFINRIIGRNAAVTGDKPGVTRNKQWLRIHPEIYLLDTPGLLWPKFEDQRCAYRLAATGAIKNDVLDVQDIAIFLMQYLDTNYAGLLEKIYGIRPEEISGPADYLNACGRRRGCLLKGGEVDSYRAARIVLDDFRRGKIGRITLDGREMLDMAEQQND
ncbi:MAG: ribosome biogenesis GTPase YlqF [Clostridia bacterium]